MGVLPPEDQKHEVVYNANAPFPTTSPPLKSTQVPVSLSQNTLHGLLVLLLEIMMTGTVFLAAPFYWYLVCGPEFRVGWYDLVDHSSNSDSEAPVWQIEVTRWSLFALHISLQFILSRRIGLLVPQIISKLSARLAATVHYSPALQRAFELFAACARHTFNFASGVSLYYVTIHLFYREERDRTWQYFLERTVLMLVFALGAILLEKIVLHLLAIEFHRSLYQDRVFKAMYNQWFINCLRSFILQAKHPASSWNKKSFPHRNSDDLMAAFLLENPTISSSFTASASASVNNPQSSTSTSKASRKGAKDQLVKDLFNFFDPVFDSTHLQLIFEDEDARKVLKIILPSSVLDTSSAGKVVIDREAVRKAFQLINKDRWDLSRALTTHVSTIKKLDRVMLGFIFAVILYFSPIIGYQLDKGNVFNFGVTLAPLIISFTEFFGDSIKRICEAIIYVVTCHPYDVGDRVSIDGVEFFVHEIGLVSTIFKRFDGFFVWIPNYVLARKALCNIRRTGMQGQRLECHVDASISMEKLQSLSNSIKEFIKSDTKDFDAVSASFFDLQQAQNRIVLVFLLRHRFNFQDGVQRAERQNRFLLFLREQVTKMDIEYRPPVLRSLLESDLQIKNHLFNIFDNANSTGSKSTEDPFTSL